MRLFITTTVCLLALLTSFACTKNSDNSNTSSTGSSTTSSDGVITGKIDLAPLLARTKVQPSAAIYLIARPSGQTAGPPLAVKQYTQPFHFPIEFTLSKQDAMMPNTPFEGSFDITVRLAQSGSATPASPGDFEGEVENGPVHPGQKDVMIRLSKVRQ